MVTGIGEKSYSARSLGYRLAQVRGLSAKYASLISSQACDRWCTSAFTPPSPAVACPAARTRLSNAPCTRCPCAGKRGDKARKRQSRPELGGEIGCRLRCGSCGGLRFFAVALDEYLRPRELQKHQPRLRYSIFAPLGNSLRRHAAQPSGRYSATYAINDLVCIHEAHFMHVRISLSSALTRKFLTNALSALTVQSTRRHSRLSGMLDQRRRGLPIAPLEGRAPQASVRLETFVKRLQRIRKWMTSK